MKPAPSKKKSSTSARAPVKTKATTKVTPGVMKKVASTKSAPRRPSVNVEKVEDELDCRASVPPRNPRHILEAADGSDDDMEEDTASKPIVVDDNDDMASDKGGIEEPEESDEAELSKWPYPVQRLN